MNRNIIRHFVQERLPVVWKIRDAQNDRRMMVAYNRRINMTLKEREDELTSLYMNYIGKQPNITCPSTYTEKIQWRKLFEHDERMTDLSNKVVVRDWVSRILGEEYLIPIYGVYNSFDEIDFNTLPKQFVLKTNHSSGWNMIVKDKDKFNLGYAKRKFDLWMSLDYAYVTGFEMQYSGIKPQIICEKYLADTNGELNDYKFLCFNGEAKYCWIDTGRSTDHKRNVYDTKWSLQPWNQRYNTVDNNVKKPKGFDEMVRVANILCKEFAHVRVDLYCLDGRVYFGEMTFTNGSGFEKIIPEEYDAKLGALWRMSHE